ncbi:hypothetical protein EXIGLDRAFT_48352 [Exidia glandulosa HHB12029]|uniref:Aprataxin and PNK-like factor PBZ domain-containing protein n=1 Tax=Exidia glandulosa HHB12029 TaxID=1314781 RepID=A0A165P6Y7_EXIGL|nr:hypothetical protein EXIGLDRAFT_48352 [Exidia glandulosa HHB12029]
MPFQRLNDDILDIILTHAADFAVVLAATLTHKRWHAAYTHHKAGIDRRVLVRVMGPRRIAAALCSIRTKAWVGPCREFTIPGQPAVEEIINRDFRECHMDLRISDAEFPILLEYARVCHQLELEYSRWSEDRPTQRARSPAERDAFQLSVYRLWRFSLFCSDDCVFQDASNDDLFSDPGFRAKIFYAAYTAQEIHNLHAIIDWMREVIGRYGSAGSMSSHTIRMCCIVGGPQTVLNIIKTPHKCRTILEAVRGLVYADRQGCAGDPRFIYEARNLLATTAAVNAIPASVDRRIITPHLYEPLCWKCLAGPGVPLFNHNNWENSPLDIRIDDSLPNWLQGNLKYNDGERRAFLQYLGIPDANTPSYKRVKGIPTIRGMTVARMFQALCCLNPRAQSVRDADTVAPGPDEFHGLTRNSLLCHECLGRLVQARLWLFWWRVKEAHSEGEARKANCWFGYLCDQQFAYHAANFNHVCRPTWEERMARGRGA